MTTLVSYDSSSDNDSENEQDCSDTEAIDINTKNPDKKGDTDSICHENSTRKRIAKDILPLKKIEEKRSRLPVPETVVSMFRTNDDHLDDPELHQGKIRTFSHERGNWASFVYIPCEDENIIKDLLESLFVFIKPEVEMFAVDDFHISLSRTIVLRHHWIESFLESLRIKIKHCSSCWCDMSELELYCNDEGTRTFLGLKVNVGENNLKNYIQEIDSALKEFNLPVYYKKPSFHVSIAWAHEDVRKKINADLWTKLQKATNDFFDSDSNSSIIQVNSLFLKTGNKVYSLPFR